MTAPDFARGVSDSQQTGDSHLLLSEVRLPEDRQLIADVLNAIKACRQPYNLCTSWTVQPVTDGYILTAYLPRPTQQLQSVEVTHDDLHLIECINLLRVRVGVAAFAQGTWGLKIHITSHGSPVSFCMYDPVRVRAKRALVRDEFDNTTATRSPGTGRTGSRWGSTSSWWGSLLRGGGGERARTEERRVEERRAEERRTEERRTEERRILYPPPPAPLSTWGKGHLDGAPDSHVSPADAERPPVQSALQQASTSQQASASQQASTSSQALASTSQPVHTMQAGGGTSGASSAGTSSGTSSAAVSPSPGTASPMGWRKRPRVHQAAFSPPVATPAALQSTLQPVSPPVPHAAQQLLTE